MTTYHDHGLNISKNQAKKIYSAHKLNRSVTIRLKNDDLHGDFKLPLTQTQLNRIH